MENANETPSYPFGNVGVISTKDAGLYVRAGVKLGLPISVKPTEGIKLDDPQTQTSWHVLSGRPLDTDEVKRLEDEVTDLLQEELKK